MADPIPVLIKQLGLRAPNGTELIPSQRNTEDIAYAFTLDALHDYRIHHLNRDPLATDNTAAGYGDHHVVINDSSGAVFLKRGQSGSSAQWEPLTGGGGGGSGAASSLVETSGPDTLAIGDVLDGQFLRRVGSSIVGGSGAGNELESVSSSRDIAASDDSKVLLVSGTTTLTLPAVDKTVLTIVNVGTGWVTVEADEGAVLSPGTAVLPPAGGGLLRELRVYTAGDGTWYVATSTQMEEVMVLALSDEVSPLQALPSRLTFRMPFPFTLTRLRAHSVEAPTGDDITIDLNVDGSSVLTTKLVIPNGSTTSLEAANPPVIAVPAIPDDALVQFDIDTVGSTVTGRGIKVALYGYRQ